MIGQTTIGVSMLDAIDDLARRMPNNETLMVARVFRVQSQTGGDLAKNSSISSLRRSRGAARSTVRSARSPPKAK